MRNSEWAALDGLENRPLELVGERRKDHTSRIIPVVRHGSRGGDEEEDSRKTGEDGRKI
jgi:hypothetical protein